MAIADVADAEHAPDRAAVDDLDPARVLENAPVGELEDIEGLARTSRLDLVDPGQKALRFAEQRRARQKQLAVLARLEDRGRNSPQRRVSPVAVRHPAVVVDHQNSVRGRLERGPQHRQGAAQLLHFFVSVRRVHRDNRSSSAACGAPATRDPKGTSAAATSPAGAVNIAGERKAPPMSPLGFHMSKVLICLTQLRKAHPARVVAGPRGDLHDPKRPVSHHAARLAPTPRLIRRLVTRTSPPFRSAGQRPQQLRNAGSATNRTCRTHPPGDRFRNSRRRTHERAVASPPLSQPTGPRVKTSMRMNTIIVASSTSPDSARTCTTRPSWPRCMK